jgi:hypothetical protein
MGQSLKKGKNTEGGKKLKRVLYLARYLMWHGLLVRDYQKF